MQELELNVVTKKLIEAGIALKVLELFLLVWNKKGLLKYKEPIDSLTIGACSFTVRYDHNSTPPKTYWIELIYPAKKGGRDTFNVRLAVNGAEDHDSELELPMAEYEIVIELVLEDLILRKRKMDDFFCSVTWRCRR